MSLNPYARKAPQRDLRIDFFRGLALLIILVDHIELKTGVYWLVYFTLHSFAPVDALDVFVFLSGYVFGLVYKSAWEHSSCWLYYRKALLRAWQLYIANSVIFFLILATIFIFSLEHADFVRKTRLNEAVSYPYTSLLRFLALFYQPYNFDILPLYIVLLVLMPGMLIFLLHNSSLALLASCSIYALTQIFPYINLPIHSGAGWEFNPFSWQFLFVIAMSLSTCRERGIRDVLNSTWILWSSTIAISVISTAYMIAENYTGRSTSGVLPWIDKTTLGPLRLFYFLCLVRTVSYCFPATATFWRSNVAALIVRCGQKSLPVFSLGVLMTYISVALQEIAVLGNLAIQFIELGAVIMSIAFANFLTVTPISLEWK